MSDYLIVYSHAQYNRQQISEKGHFIPGLLHLFTSHTVTLFTKSLYTKMGHLPIVQKQKLMN